MHSTALRYFLEVVEAGSIADASTRLNVAASAISRQVSRLEASLGVALFERRPRGMVPSAAGELLARHARRVFLDEDQVVQELQRLRGLATGVVRIGCTEGFAIDFLPESIRDFRLNYPGIRFELKVSVPATVIRMVREGDVDIGLTFGFALEPGVRVELAGRSPIMALMAPEHRLATRESIKLEELVQHPIALPERDTTARQLFDIACGLAGVAIEPAFVSSYMGALWAFAEVGGGITITGRITVFSRLRRFRLVARPIEAAGVDQRRYEIQTMLGRALPDAAHSFLQHLIRVLREIEASPAGG